MLGIVSLCVEESVVAVVAVVTVAARCTVGQPVVLGRGFNFFIYFFLFLRCRFDILRPISFRLKE